MSREDPERRGTAAIVEGTEHREREMHTDAPARPVQEGVMRAERQAAGGMQPQPMPQQNVPPQQAMPQPTAQRQQPAPNQPQPMRGEAGRPQQQQGGGMPQGAAEQLAALFPPQVAADFRHRWDQVQIGFVDDPRRAVQQADELVAEVMKSLAASFAEQRSRLEAGLGRGADTNTEDLRVALRGYRSFFQRLLSL